MLIHALTLWKMNVMYSKLFSFSKIPVKLEEKLHATCIFYLAHISYKSINIRYPHMRDQIP